MSNILEKGDIIKKIRDGVDLDEIMSYARNSLYKDGPTDTIVLEILSYIKMFHPDYFKDYENDIVATMGLYFKNPVPESLEGLILTCIINTFKKNGERLIHLYKLTYCNRYRSRSALAFQHPRARENLLYFGIS